MDAMPILWRWMCACISKEKATPSNRRGLVILPNTLPFEKFCSSFMKSGYQHVEHAGVLQYAPGRTSDLPCSFFKKIIIINTSKSACVRAYVW